MTPTVTAKPPAPGPMIPSLSELLPDGPQGPALGSPTSKVVDATPAAPDHLAPVERPTAAAEEPEVAEARRLLKNLTGPGEVGKGLDLAAFFGQSVVALQMNGQSPATMKGPLREAYKVAVEMIDEAKTGGMDAIVAVQIKRTEAVKAKVAADVAAQIAKRNRDQKSGDLNNLAPDDPRTERYTKELAAFKVELKEAENEVFRIEKRVLPALDLLLRG